jgi:gluconolactonase
MPAVWGGEQLRLRKPQNIAFAGPGKRTLFIVGSGAVFKVQTLTQGPRNRAK